MNAAAGTNTASCQPEGVLPIQIDWHAGLYNLSQPPTAHHFSSLALARPAYPHTIYTLQLSYCVRTGTAWERGRFHVLDSDQNLIKICKSLIPVLPGS